MYKVMLFAGTTEGRMLVERFAAENIQFHVFVATEYGRSLIEPGENIMVYAQRLDLCAMERRMQEGWDVVIDATHPYAVQVTEQIRTLSEQEKLPYIRIVRGSASVERQDGIIYVPDMEQAAAYLNGTEGRVLLTTGSKDLEVFTKVKHYEHRLIARVLPVEESVRKCMELGFCGKQLICMQGPFSAEMNREMLQQTEAAWLVTKESGKIGGFQEKIDGAVMAGAGVIVVGRPSEETGYVLEDAVKYIEKAAGIERVPAISLVGIGPGGRQYMSRAAVETIRRADLLIGAKRMLEMGQIDEVDSMYSGKAVFQAWDPHVMRKFLQEHPEYRRPVLLLSGDTGFYSGAVMALEVFRDYKTDIVPGISSLTYMMAGIGRAWQDVKLVSMHGRPCNIISQVRRNQKVFLLLTNGEQIRQICRELAEYGFSDVRIWIGSQLGMAGEEITEGGLADIELHEFPSLSVMYIERPDVPEPVVTQGVADEAFIRDKVPMTKREVRALSLAALELKKDSVLYDVGAGTGSVSIEAALQAYDGQITAIEKKEHAVQLIERNKREFQVSNVKVIHGEASEILKDLKAPTHVFIGGSSGNMIDMLEWIRESWKDARIVINAAALETQAEVTGWLKAYPQIRHEVIQVQASRAKRVGQYHLMEGQNPVYIITIPGGVYE